MGLTKTKVIPFFRPTVTGSEMDYLAQVTGYPNRLGEKEFTQKATGVLQQLTGREVLLAKSCTQALELSAMLCNIRPGDEVVLPSFGFVACANAFVARGARLVFADIRPDTMNIDERCLEDAITPQTKAALTINYSGIGCEYDSIRKTAEKHSILLIEDNAQGLFGKYKGRPLGTFGDASTLSFDHLKNITCGQGGALSFDKKMRNGLLEYYYEFGTNKAEFIRGESPSYEWKSPGSNFYLSELLAAFLYAQLSEGEKIIARFRSHWDAYAERLQPLASQGKITLLDIPRHCEHNSHNFCIKTKDKHERSALMDSLKSQGIYTTFHYVPLHSSSFGKEAGRFHGEDKFTTRESERLLRLPLFHDLTPDDIDYVCSSVYGFYKTPY